MSEKVYAFGYPTVTKFTNSPFANRGNFTLGEVSSFYRDGRFIHTADTHSGNSGGPLLDHGGRLIGVNTAKKLDIRHYDNRRINTAQRANIGIGYSNIVRFLASQHGVQLGEGDTYRRFRKFMEEKIAADVNKTVESPDAKNFYAQLADLFRVQWPHQQFLQKWGQLAELMNWSEFRIQDVSALSQDSRKIHRKASRYTVELVCLAQGQQMFSVMQASDTMDVCE